MPTGVYERKIKPIEWTVNKNGCHVCISHSLNSKGYPKTKIKGKTRNIHRIIYENNFGEIPKDMVVMHICDNPNCINPEHLKLGTHADNMKDMKNKERQFRPRGELNSMARLTKEQVISIRLDNRNRREIAKEYNVCFQTITDIKGKRAWRDVF